MGKSITFVGAGAIGAYVGGRMARGKENVTLIDPWPDHIDHIKQNGLQIYDSEGEYSVNVKAMHLHEVQNLIYQPVDIAFICVKSYDTEWATMLIKQYLAPNGFVVSLQNSINEERIASIVGWGKTLGCIGTNIGVDAFEAGKVRRSVQPGGKDYDVFRVGEVHGRITERAKEVARLLAIVDSATVTTNLWGERWSKLTYNCMANSVSALTNLDSKSIRKLERPRRVMIELASEAIKVGYALGYELDIIHGIAPDKWIAASEGDSGALEEVENSMVAFTKRMTETLHSSSVQDIIKGRRTEINFLNGLVVCKGRELGIPTPTHSAIIELIKQVERGELLPCLENITKI